MVNRLSISISATVRVRGWLLGLLALLGGGLAGPVWAVDSPPAPSVQETDPLGKARAAIKQQRWDQALTELQRVNSSRSADWNNLMGFALRKRAAPDLAAAQRHYDAALQIDPNHLGALEYAGELALIKGELPVAEAHLAKLARLCATGCEERSDLERAVARFKADGRR
jgi:Flp pilus assembly protein TadD